MNNPSLTIVVTLAVCFAILGYIGWLAHGSVFAVLALVIAPVIGAGIGAVILALAAEVDA